MDDDAWIQAEKAAAGPCPACGSDTAQPILYGMPMPEDFQRLQGTVEFAGCLVPEHPARFSCSRCRTTWGRAVWLNDDPAQAVGDGSR